MTISSLSTVTSSISNSKTSTIDLTNTQWAALKHYLEGLTPFSSYLARITSQLYGIWDIFTRLRIELRLQGD